MPRRHQHGERPRQLPARLERAGLDRGRFGGRLVHEHPHEPPAVKLGLAGRGRLLARVALRRLCRERIDVGEDRFGEEIQRLWFEPGGAPEGDKPPPCHPGSGPVGTQQRVETPAGAHLALAKRPIHVRALDWAAGLDLGEEVV